jgi:hypothetical protein
MNTKTKHLYVSLANDRDSVLVTLLLNPAKLALSGRIRLKDSLPSGYYWLTAYPDRTADSNYADKTFPEPIYIVNMRFPQQNPPAQIESADSGSVNRRKWLNLKFYPEGNAIITGANSAVGYQVLDRRGKPATIDSGYVKDSRGNTVAKLMPDKYGRGKFEFFPSKYRAYTAFIFLNGNPFIFPLPSFNFHAAQLSVVKEDGNKKLRVLLEDSIYGADYHTYIIGVARNEICFKSDGTGNYEISLPESDLPHGIIRFYLFNDLKTLLSERNIYISRKDYILTVKTDKNIYGRRDIVHLSLAVTDLQQHPILASLSVTAADSHLLYPVSDQCLMSDYNNPGNEYTVSNYYLDHAENLSDEQIDLLMLSGTDTSKKIWGPDGNFSPNDSLLFIKGEVLDVKGSPAKNTIVTLFSKSGRWAFSTDTTGTDGRFIFPLTEYPDSSLFGIQTTNLRHKPEDLKVFIDSLSFPRPPKALVIKKRFKTDLSYISNYLNLYNDTSSLTEGFGNEYLKPVTIRGQRKGKNEYDEHKRISPFSRIITSKQLRKSGPRGIGNALLRIPGFQVINGYASLGGIAGLHPGPATEPIVVVDGAEVPLSASGDGIGTISPVISYLNGFDPNDVDFIEVLSGPESSGYGVRGGHGVIIINTRSSSPETMNTGQKKLKFFLAKGYYVPQQFIVPDYRDPGVRTARFKDDRLTLYWNGSIVTDSLGKADISFYTGDVPGTYNIIISGITIFGDWLYRKISIQTR